MSFNDSYYHICYRFNHGFKNNGENIPIKKSNSSGVYHGLSIYLVDNTFNSNGQYVVHIHNKTNTPNSLYNLGYFISSGVNNYFSIKRIYEQKLEEPYNPCL